LIIGFNVVCFAQSEISGIIYDKQRNPLPNLDVELLNDYYQTINRLRTDGSGRYQFGGLRNGRYSIKVYAFQYDLEDQTQEQEINTQNIRGGEGVGFFLLDFYLLPKKGGLAETENSVIFAQDIPAEAKKLYNQATIEFSKNKTDEGIITLNNAIKILPDYFLALQRIGKELYIKKRYEESAHFLFKAVQVNPRSANSFYYLGSSLHRLGKDYDNAALTSLKQAAVLAPLSVQVLWILGVVERSVGNFKDAEIHLLKAKKVSQKSVPEIHKELAQLYSDNLKKYGEAADELEFYIKASKLSEEEIKTIQKVIAGLREKVKK
jgi:tetratricopeptide (TPR) repeat protein